MKKHFCGLICCAWCAGAIAADILPPGAAFRLADVCVVCAPCSDRAENAALRTTAAELTNLVFRKTGAAAPIVSVAEPGRPAIYLGDAAKKTSGLDLADLRRGDWRVKIVPGKAFLLGNTAAAVNGAFVEFCQRALDHYFLTIEGDDPCSFDAACTVPVLDVTVRPAIYCREIYHGMFDGRRYPTTKRNWERWSRLHRAFVPATVEGRHRLSYSVPRQCHSQFYYVHPDKWFKTHPEYYSMGDNGKRSAIFDFDSQLCYSSTGALEVCCQSLENFIAQDRAKRPTDYPCIYDFTQHDNSSHLCRCPACKATIAKYNRVPGGFAEGGDAGLQLEFVNALARRIRVKYPDVQLRTFAYVSTECPPKEGTIKPEDNVVIWWCDVYSHSDHTLPLETRDHFNGKQAAELDGWLKLTKNVQLWDYMLYTHDFPEVSPRALAADARFFAARGLPAIFMETEYRNQPFWFLNAFLMGELYVDPTRDVDQLLHVYCRVYGPAAEKMENAIRLLDKMQQGGPAATEGAWHGRFLPWLSRENLAALATLFKDAHDVPGLTTHERARIAAVLASTWKQLVVLLKQDPARAAEYAEARRAWVQYEKECARDGLMEEKDRAAAAAKIDEELELLTLSFDDLPPELKSVPAKDLVCVDWHFGSPRVKDEKSSRGQAVATKVGDRYFAGKLPMPCGVYDFSAKKGDAYKIERLPADGSYAWVKLGPAYVGRNSRFWFPGSWQSSFELKTFHVLADGLAVDPNKCEAWCSARLAGDRVYVDRLVFRRLAQ